MTPYTDIKLVDGMLTISVKGVEKVMKAKVSPVEIHFPKGESILIELKVLETIGFTERDKQ